jgi:CheY-like chemotaxis protein
MTRSRRVLLVEDDREIRETITDILRDEGHVVMGAGNGQEALEELSRAPADVILLDLMMPVMDGWQFRAEQQKHPVWRHIPVIVVSADAQIADKARSIGAHGFLRKPLNIDDLLRLVAEVGAAVTPTEGAE